ncbi:uncharacterized protein PRCAT00003940001 [Priceomyces carsonii]|uniref:uncharacterized protein n=1 Tax=Priceomyces carsonii TaxID=28549 RepID=UPI002ED7F386|nr:unnamed protein product [Priceomyces carsonii]
MCISCIISNKSMAMTKLLGSQYDKKKLFREVPIALRYQLEKYKILVLQIFVQKSSFSEAARVSLINFMKIFGKRLQQEYP